MYPFLVFLAQPTFILFVLVGLALANLWRKRKESRGRLLLVTIPYLLLLVLCIPGVGFLAQAALERSYPLTTDVPEDTEAIVVLSGSLLSPDHIRTKAELGPDTLYRCLHAVKLHQKAPHCLLLVTGGRPEGAPPGPPLAEVMRDFLKEQGVPESKVLIEDQSQTTYENAVKSGELLRQRSIRRIVLVTDAEHMYRATLCFRKQGLEVTPSACNHVATRFEGNLDDFLPSPRRAGKFERAFHEYLGLVYYWVKGRI
jgi:uncharacterized SAM-binding protein YcdF (DUF218 family)